MKTVRVWLLVLLSVLLPLRGAVAAGMLCPCAAVIGTSQHSSGLEPAGSMAEAMHPQAHEHDEHSGLHVHSGFAAHHGHADASHSDKCTLCADCCSVSVLATVMETVVEPLEPSAQTFPASAPPVPSFVSGGQERPPRSI